MNKEKVSVDLINKLANYGLLQSLAKQDAEISYVEEFTLKNYSESMNNEVSVFIGILYCLVLFYIPFFLAGRFTGWYIEMVVMISPETV